MPPRFNPPPAGVPLLLGVFLLRAALALAVVPPWQQPDEPFHFEWIRILATSPSLRHAPRADDGVEREILNSMADYEYWRHLSRATPRPLATRFADDPGLAPFTAGGLPTAPPLYYVLSAVVVRASPARSLIAQLTVTRGLSVVLGLAAVWFVHAATRRLQGEGLAFATTALLVLHPQFLLTSVAATPDMLLAALGAIAFWAGARLWTGAPFWPSATTLGAVAAAAILTKRAGAVLAVVALLVVIVEAGSRWPGRLRDRRHGRRVLFAAAAILAAAALAIVSGEGLRLLTGWSSLFANPLMGGEGLADRTITFVRTLVDSGWLRFGWLTYGPPAWWIAASWALTLLAVLGAIDVFSPDARRRAAALFASVFTFATVILLAAALLPRGLLAQGRYGFVALGPFLLLLVLALGDGSGPGVRARWTLVVAIVAALDLYGWLSVGVPIYLR